MNKLSESQRAELWESAKNYARSLPGTPAEEYLARRGITQQETTRFGLGYVVDPRLGHEMYQGWLTIPYLRPSHTGRLDRAVSIRFRCLEDHVHEGHGKYMTVAGDRPRMFNTAALLRESARVVIVEGEVDAITVESCGVPAVGIPGVQTWQRWYREPFLGYREVLILADGDKPGKEFADTLAKTLPNAKVIPFPPGEDANSFVLKNGKDALLERIGQ